MSIKLKNLKSLLFWVLLLAVPFAYGQSQTVNVSGKITDPNGESLPGVNIVVKGTTQGTVSDMDGNYQISVPSGSTIVISYIGYLSQEVMVDHTQKMDMQMKTDVANLEEVVVIGYGSVKKADATGSVTAVSAKDFNKGAITSAQDLLIGKTAGVSITTSGGAPGSGSTIRIRGGSSLNATNDPLIVVDGMPISNNDVSGSSNALSFLNPNDIESFTVLKDASATAIYGSRASNGVILITTKKGKKGAALKVTYDGNVSFANAIKYQDVFSGDEVRQIAYDKLSVNGVSSLDALGSENTNWQKEIFRTAISTDHNLSVSGSYKSLPYRAAVGYTNQNGILVNTNLQRITGSLNLNPTFLKDNLKVNLSMKAMNTKNNFGESGAIGSAVSMDPTHPVKDGNTDSNGYFQWENYGASLGTANPVEQAKDIDNKSDVNRFIGNIQLDYALPFISGLKANLNLSTDYTKSTGHNNRPTTSPSVLTNPYWGKINSYNSEYTNNLLDFYLNYVKDLTAIKSKVDVTAGYSWQHFDLKNHSSTHGYLDAPSDMEVSTDTVYTNDPKRLQLISFFGRVYYTLMDRYLVTFTLRDDGSSRFSKNNRWGYFPSVAFAWKLKDESFFKNINALSALKLRLGWGKTGQQDIGDYFPYMATYTNSTAGNYYYIDGEYISTLRPDAYDENIKWEETTTQNVGFDFGFINDRITGSFDLYKRVTNDLLNDVTVPTMSNFSNTLYTNVGNLENKGFEFSLNLVPISTKDMSLNIAYNLTYNQTKITKLLMSDDPSYVGVLYGDAFTGQKQVSRVGYAPYSFFVNKQVYNSNGKPIEGLYEDLSGAGGTVSGDNSDKYIFHKPAPDYTMGLSIRFTYKQFDLSASSRASIGNYAYNAVAAGSSYDQMYQIGYWKNMPRSLKETNFMKRQFTSDYFVENASFFKLDNLSAGYNLNNLIKGSTAHVSFTVQNVFTITKYSGLDPEVPFSSGRPGVDGNFYPRARTFMVGLSLGF